MVSARYKGSAALAQKRKGGFQERFFMRKFSLGIAALIGLTALMAGLASAATVQRYAGPPKSPLCHQSQQCLVDSFG